MQFHNNVPSVVIGRLPIPCLVGIVIALCASPNFTTERCDARSVGRTLLQALQPLCRHFPHPRSRLWLLLLLLLSALAYIVACAMELLSEFLVLARIGLASTVFQ